MEWFEAYQADMQAVFAEAERLIAQYPQPLNDKGLEYAAEFNPCQEDSKKNYICYLLPMWLDQQTGLDKDVLRKLSLASVFVILYFFLQDDVMDSPSTHSKEQLPLANLFYLDSLRLYREMFSADSPFWSYMEQYVREWSDSVTNESRQNYFVHDMSLMSYKASFVKLASTGALLLAGQGILIPRMSEQVDAALVALQMVDDWTDWQEDLEEGSYNGLLAMLQGTHSAPLTAQSVKHELYVGGLLGQYAQVAEGHRKKQLSAGTYAPHLDRFHQSLVDNLVSEADRLQQEKLSLLHGGLFYHLVSNNSIFS